MFAAVSFVRPVVLNQDGLYYFPVLNTPVPGGEADPYFEDLAGVGGEWLYVAFFCYLS